MLSCRCLTQRARAAALRRSAASMLARGATEMMAISLPEKKPFPSRQQEDGEDEQAGLVMCRSAMDSQLILADRGRRRRALVTPYGRL